MSIRKRLSPDESRRIALEAASALLMEGGPQAVTLKAVAARIDRTHANLLHHFGTAADLQRALAEYMARTICVSVGETVRAMGQGVATPRDVVDMTFDAYGRRGGGALASWMLASGNEDALDPLVETIQQVVDELHPQEQEEGAPRPMHEATFALTLLALGDALIGDRLAQSLRVKRDIGRDKAEAMMVASFKEVGYLPS